MYKIDAHNHPDFGLDFEKQIANMDELGISKACLLSIEGPWDEHGPSSACPISNEYVLPLERCLYYRDRAPERFIIGYAPDPRESESLFKLKNAINTYGVQVYGEAKFRMMYDNPDAIEIFQFCGENGLPVILHFDYAFVRKPNMAAYRRRSWFGGDIDTLERLLQLCPDTKFLGHAPGFWGCISDSEEWKSVVYPDGPVVRGGKVEQLLEKYDNLYCDCSGDSGRIAISRDPEYTKLLMTKFPNRFIYARDGFDNKLAEFVDTLDLPEDILEGFYHKNFEALLPYKK